MHGLKKAVSRATTSVMQSTGAIDKTVDRDFEEEERRLKTLENKAENLHREAKGYLDAVRGMTLAQQRIAETITSFYEDGSPLGYAGSQYKLAVNKIDEEARSELDTNYRITVLDPLGKFVAVFPEFNEARKVRQKKMLDYDRTRANVRKLVERPSDDPQRLPRAEAEANQAKEIYEHYNQQLVGEIPKLVDMRVPYLEPCFEALVKSQLRFNQSAFQKLNEIRTAFPNEGRGLEGQVEGVLQQMRELAICGSH
ncbi:BAR domain-containing protein [Phlyctochytrium arcticum]|nr:BAR domain-containing protein [Phlyctochytrium arcticum]